MRILQIGKYYHPHQGGIETHLRQLSLGLQTAASVNVIVAGKTQSPPENIDGVTVERLPSPIRLFGAPICPFLISRLRESNADIVHIHLPNPWAAIAYLLSSCRIPLVVTYHSDIIRQSFLEQVVRPIHVEFLRRASAIISTSQNLIDHSNILRRFRDRCSVIPFGADIQQMEEIDSTKVQAIIRTCKPPIILAVGRLVTYKGFEYLIRAIAGVDASLIIVGKGPLQKKLIRLARDLNIAEKVKIFSDIVDATPFYHAAEIFVLPSISRNEAFGIVQIEAMAAGKPVINTQIASGVPSVSLHGVTGLTIPPKDVGALTLAIKQLLGNPQQKLAYGNAARMRARSEFALDAMISRTLDLYEVVLNRRREPAAKALSWGATAGD